MDEIDLLKGFRDDMPEPTTDAWLRARAAIAAARAEPGNKRTTKLNVRWFRPLYAMTLAAVAIVSALAGAFLTQVPATPSAEPPPATAPPAASPAPSHALRTEVADAMRSDANYIVLTQSTIWLSNGTVDTMKWYDQPWTGLPGTQVEQTGKEWDGVVETRAWSLKFIVPQRYRLSAGNDIACQLNPHGITVDYPYHTWQSTPPPCVTLPPGLDWLVPTLRAIGYPVVQGQKTIEFQSVGKNKTFTLWISTVTHLPLQSRTTLDGQWTELDQYTFLLPTPFNHAKLTLTPPTGFSLTTVQHGAA